MRGLLKRRQQCLLAATAQNIKKIALLLGGTGPNASFMTLRALFAAHQCQLLRYHNLIPASDNFR